MSSTDLKNTIDLLLESEVAASHLVQCLQELDDKESIGLLTQIKSRLDARRHDIEQHLPDYVYDRGVQWAALELGVSIANMLPTHLKTMLSHQNADIRLVAVRCGDLNTEQLENALNDKDQTVRNAAQRRNSEGNKPLIEKGPSIGLAAIARIA